MHPWHKEEKKLSKRRTSGGLISPLSLLRKRRQRRLVYEQLLLRDVCMSGSNQSLVLPFADYIPKARLIANVTSTKDAVVTTTEEHGYSAGWSITLLVPPEYGMTLLFQDCRILEVIDAISFRTDLDLSQVDQFVAPSFPPSFTQAQVVPQSGTTFNNLTPIPPSLA